MLALPQRFASGAMLAALLAVTALIYWPGLNGPLILDDAANLDILRLLSDQQRLTLGNVLAERGGVLGGRPVSWATFLANWSATGDDVWWFKLTNLALHLVNGVLVFALARILLGTSGRLGRTAVIRWALATAGLWLLTPIQVSTVLYVVQRMTVLSALFCLLGLLLFCHGRLLLARRGVRAVMLMGASVVICWPLAAMSKQNGALLIFLILAAEALVLRPALDGPRWPLFTLAGAGALLLAAGAIRVFLDPAWLTSGYALRDFDLYQRLITQPRVLVDYLLNTLQLPGGSPLGLFHDDFPVSTSVLSPPWTLAALAFWLAVVVLALRGRGRPGGLAWFGLFFFLVGHALEAGPFPLEIYFEHRNYLPAVGAILALIALIVQLRPSLRGAALLPVVACVLIAWHAGLTFTRVLAWSSWEGIITLNARSHPRSPRARAGAAIIDLTEGRLDDGLRHLAAVRELGGPRMQAGVALKTLAGHCIARRSPPAQVYSNLAQIQASGDDSYTVGALRWYRTLAVSGRCTGVDTARVAESVSDLAAKVTVPGRFVPAWILHDEAAHLLEAAGRPLAAAAHLRRAISWAPRSQQPALRSRLRELTGAS